MAQVTAEAQSHSQAELNRSVRELICATTVTACTGAFGECLQAVILTGSMARDEASIVSGADQILVWGDADFLLVFGRRADQPPASRLHQVAEAVSAELRQKGLQTHVSLASVIGEYFRRLPPHSYTYELKRHGATIWGDTRPLASTPGYSTAQLSREDAWRTVCNRMIELLGSIAAARPNSEPLPETTRYAAVKLCLDVATSYLIFAGAYEPTNSARSRRLGELAAAPSNRLTEPFPLAEFAVLVERCTLLKLQPSSGDSPLPSNVLEQVIWYACQLWRWEVAQLLKVNRNANVAALMHSLAARQSLATRLRGWLSLFRRVERVVSSDSVRWMKLFRHATPRYLVYEVAAEVFFRLPCLLASESPPGLNVSWSELRQRLPVVHGSQGHEVHRWTDVAAEIMWNYQRFLMGTSA